jgi:YggT family protein
MISFLVNLHGWVQQAFNIYRMILLAYFLMSWLPGAYESKLGEILTRICEPYVGIFRRFVPPVGMISFAGIVALLALEPIRLGTLVIIERLIMFLI